MGLDGCSSFQILLNFSCIFPIESFRLLVEFSIPLINVVNIRIIIIRTSPAVFVSFFNLFFQVCDHPVNFLCGRHMCPMKKTVGRWEKLFSTEKTATWTWNNTASVPHFQTKPPFVKRDKIHKYLYCGILSHLFSKNKRKEDTEL